MAASDLTVTGTLTDALGTAYDYTRTKMWVTFNTENGRVTDDEGVIRLDAGTATVNSDGTFSLAGIPCPGASNPISFQVKIHFDAPPRLPGPRDVKRFVGDFGWMTITEDSALQDLEDEQSVPAEYQTAFTESMESILDESQANLDAQIVISGIDDTDSAVAGLITNPLVGPLTNIALGTSFRQQRTATIALFGDSRTDSCDSSSGGGWFSTNLSWWDFGQAAAGGARFDVVASAGVAGNTTTQMLARMDADVIAYSPGYMTLWGGTNDNWTAGTSAVDASYALMVQMMEKARLAGIYTFLISETTASTNGTTFPALVAYYNDKLRRYAAQNAEVEFWDFNAVFTDPALSTGYPKAALTSDGLHLSVAGASSIGVNVVAPALARFPKITNLVCSQLDVQAINAASKNVLGNPMMLNTNGTVGTGFTGTMPSSWAVARSNANISGTVTTTARSDSIGSDIVCAVTASAAGSANLTSTVNIARLTAGQQYVIECAYEITSPSNLYALTVALQEYYASGASVDTFGACWSVASAVGTSANDTILAHAGVLRSRIFTSRVQNDLSTAQLLVQVRFAGSGSATVKFGRPSIKRVS